MLKINLQHFAGEEFTPDVGGVEDRLSYTAADESEEKDDTVEEDESTEQKDGEADDASEDDAEDGKDKKPSEPDDATPWGKKRLARAERAFERKFMDEINAESDGHEIPRRDLSKAVKLWNTLRVNPELSARINQLVSTEITSGKAKTLDLVQPTGGVDVREQRLALRESKLEFRESDPVYRKYEQEILEWAEDEGLRVRTERDLKGAIREWKGAHARTLSAKADVQKPPAKKPSSVVPPAGAKSQGGKTQGPIDYRKTSTQEILKREGTSFFLAD